VQKPFQKGFAVGCRQDVIERIVVSNLRDSQGDRQQMQIVIPEDDRCGIAHRADPPQCLQRFGPPVDEIADEPKPVAVRGEFYRFEQRS